MSSDILQYIGWKYTGSKRTQMDAATQVTNAMVELQAHKSRAIALLTSPKVRTAFDLSQNPDLMRDRDERNTARMIHDMASRLRILEPRNGLC